VDVGIACVNSSGQPHILKTFWGLQQLYLVTTLPGFPQSTTTNGVHEFGNWQWKEIRYF